MLGDIFAWHSLTDSICTQNKIIRLNKQLIQSKLLVAMCHSDVYPLRSDISVISLQRYFCHLGTVIS